MEEDLGKLINLVWLWELDFLLSCVEFCLVYLFYFLVGIYNL